MCVTLLLPRNILESKQKSLTLSFPGFWLSSYTNSVVKVQTWIFYGMGHDFMMWNIWQHKIPICVYPLFPFLLRIYQKIGFWNNVEVSYHLYLSKSSKWNYSISIKNSLQNRNWNHLAINMFLLLRKISTLTKQEVSS